ncbi:hypothetical protein BBJ29_002551 [Phytophthora kernoviae]|uniref:Serine hydrolase domain-containing protein n=1 Tax=Phytophthora kernoviae TaxID=325452 RepID=A0A3F2RZV1_9STRA|nr:hypothetical protein BBJ29_002551 [Phytophthora kernoviae]RLN66995.1 hypothetical protein BBP00_00001904 [Phytophthora kernoviae]
MESQTQGLRDALGPNAEFVFLNAPFEARGPTDEVVERLFGDTAPFYEWWSARSLEKDEREVIEGEEGAPQGTTKQWCLEFEDIDQSFEFMDEQLKELGEFDLAVGFSQGSIMLTLLSMWYLRKANKRWWKLLLCVCGVNPQAAQSQMLTRQFQELLKRTMAAEGANLPTPAAISPRSLGPSEKLRILCLHGFRTNKQVMIDQTRGLRAALGSSAEFVILNGTYEAEGPSDPMIESVYASSAPFYEWFENQLANGQPLLYNDAESSAKARLLSGADKGEDHAWSLSYKGVEQSMKRLDEEIRRHGPFDVVIGFSQGAALLSIMTMWYLRHGGVRWWKLAICVGGVDVSAVNVKSLFIDEMGHRVLVPLPSIHLIGKTDPLFHESHRLAKSWTDEADGFERWVFEHDGGHKFPAASRNKEFYVELGRVIRQHCRKGTETTVSKL